MQKIDIPEDICIKHLEARKEMRVLLSREASRPDLPLVRSQRADFPHWAHDKPVHLGNGAKIVHGEL